MTPSPILGGFYESRSLLLNAQRCVNLYPEMVETHDGKTAGALYGCPGLRTVHTGAVAPWRALYANSKGALFGVRGAVVYQISGGFGLSTLGVLGTTRGPVKIVDSGKQVLFVDGERAYGYDLPSNRFLPIDLPFTANAPLTCAYQDQFFLMNETGTTKWWQSDNNDVFTWNALNFSSKDGQPDPIVAMIDNHREVWLLGTRTTEVWINAGDTGFAFRRLQGVFIQEGCAAPNSAAIAGTSVMWLSRSSQGQAMVIRSVGYQVQRVSTHAIERELQSYTRVDDAIAWVYQQEGHVFYVLTFPHADKTWCYDLTTGLWHERASFLDGEFRRHRSNCCAFFGRENIVGDYENGKLYALDLDIHTDDDQRRKWLRSWPAQGTAQITRTRDRYDELEVYMEVGGAEPPDQVRSLDQTDYVRTLDDTFYVRVLSGVETPLTENYRNPQVMLRWSDTGGRSWGNEHWRPVGRIGELKHRVNWHAMGVSRDRIFELSATDPFKPAILGAFLKVAKGVN